MPDCEGSSEPGEGPAVFRVSTCAHCATRGAARRPGTPQQPPRCPRCTTRRSRSCSSGPGPGSAGRPCPRQKAGEGCCVVWWGSKWGRRPPVGPAGSNWRRQQRWTSTSQGSRCVQRQLLQRNHTRAGRRCNYPEPAAPLLMLMCSLEKRKRGFTQKAS